MIQQVASLGFMSALGSPMLLKLVPKKAIGSVIKKVADHYMKSGNFLHEAMESAAEETFLAIRMGLQAGLLRKATASKTRKEFVEKFRESYLKPFLEVRPELDDDTFCKESAKLCKVAIRELASIMDELAPQEEHVQQFFSESYITNSQEVMGEGQAALKEKIKSIEGLNNSFVGLLFYQGLLFEGLHFFFRQKIATEPEMKAIFDELNQMELLKEVKASRLENAELKQNIEELLDALRSGGLQGNTTTDGASQAWNDFQFHFSRFEQTVGLGLRELQHDLRRQTKQLRKELQSDIREEAEKTRDMIARVLAELQEIKRGGALEKTDQHSQEDVHRVRSMMSHIGLPDSEIKQLTKAKPRIGGSGNLQNKAAQAYFELVGQEGEETKNFTIFLDSKVSFGRHSQKDGVLYWYPLPNPPSLDNQDWQNWKGQGTCHPTLNVSSHHFDLQWNGRETIITDFSSKGTFLGSQRLPKQTPVALKDGNVIDVAGVIKLSYTLLTDEEGSPYGWRLRRLNNLPGYEEFLFFADETYLTIGSDREDDILLALPGIRPTHAALRRNGHILFIDSYEEDFEANGSNLEEEVVVDTGFRLSFGEQVAWLFPPGTKQNS